MGLERLKNDLSQLLQEAACQCKLDCTKSHDIVVQSDYLKHINLHAFIHVDPQIGSGY